MKWSWVSTAIAIVWGVVILATAIVLNYASNPAWVLLILGLGSVASLIILGRCRPGNQGR
jgi:hypothetical protein